MKILLPVDFSKESHHANEFAKSLAMKLRAELFLLHVYYDPFVHQDMPPVRFEGTEKVTEEVLHQVDIEAKASLNELHIAIKRELPMLSIQSMAMRGLAEDEITRFSRHYLPDLILMGTEAGSTLAKTLAGSLTMKVIDAAIAPVLVVPTKAQPSELNHVVYATNFHPEDDLAVRALRKLFSKATVTISQIHITAKNERLPEKEAVEIIHADDLVSALEAYTKKNPRIIVSMTTHHRGVFQRIFNPGITRQMVFHSEVPLLIFGEKKS